MRKYLFIIKTEIMSNLQYVANLFISFIGYFIMLFILFSLWKYLYSDPSEVINGYSMSQMTWYVIVTEILWSVLGGRKLTHKISQDVKTGNITYNINKPYNYVTYSLATHFGSVFLKGIVYIFLGMLTGFIFIGSFPKITILEALVVLFTGIIATLISTLLIICIGLVSFFIEDSGPLYWVYSKVILVLGTIFPIEYFPKFLQGILSYSPVFVVCYGPAKLFVNFSWSSAITVILAQFVYVIIVYLLCLFIYKKGVKRINVNGG